MKAPGDEISTVSERSESIDPVLEKLKSLKITTPILTSQPGEGSLSDILLRKSSSAPATVDPKVMLELISIYRDWQQEKAQNISKQQGPNKKILCQLSMLERRIAQGAENQGEIVEQSIQHAKEAIALDVKDGSSWYNLGNSCLTSFFVTGAWDHCKFLQSLKAYQNAEKDERMKSNPDLYFNCATL